MLAGASAADNAAMALESGAASVRMFVRREHMQRVQPYRWLTFAGFLRHYADLDDAWAAIQRAVEAEPDRSDFLDTFAVVAEARGDLDTVARSRETRR